jgi:hypothetical protein
MADDRCCANTCRGLPCPSTSDISSSASIPVSSGATDTSTPTASTTASNNANSRTELAGIIAGSVIAGVGGLLGLVGIICYLKPKRSASPETTGQETSRAVGEIQRPAAFPNMSIEPGVRGLWAAPEHLRNPQPTMNSTTISNASEPITSPTKGGAQTALSPSGGYIKPFFLDEDRHLTRSPVSPVSPTDHDNESTFRSLTAPSTGKIDTGQVEEHSQKDTAQRLLRTSDEFVHGEDPNGSETYEMTRWGKQIQQTNMT